MERKYKVLLAIVAVVVVLDQWTKYLAVANLTSALEREGRVTLPERIGGFYSIRDLDGDSRDPARGDLRKAPKVVVPGYWNHRYVENPGAAWGFLSDAPDRFRIPFFHLVSLGAMVFIGFFFRRVERDQRLLAVALSLVLGGALGNYIDRIARNYVIDFIDWHWRGQPHLHWPTFNIADVAITCGMLLMLFESFFGGRREPSGMSGAEVAVEGAPPASGAAGGPGPEASRTGVDEEAPAPVEQAGPFDGDNRH